MFSRLSSDPIAFKHIIGQGREIISTGIEMLLKM
jgi:hypothetical protein